MPNPINQAYQPFTAGWTTTNIQMKSGVAPDGSKTTDQIWQSDNYKKAADKEPKE